jgi:hypothetical protein
VAFLDGDDEIMFDAIWRELDLAAETMNFERARKLRNDLQILRGIVDAHQLLRKAEERQTLVLVQPGPESGEREVMLIVHGRRWAALLVGPLDSAASLADRLGRAWRRHLATGLAPVTQLTLDEANILGRWLARHDGHPAILPVEECGEIDWLALAGKALALADAELNWTPPVGEDIVVDEFSTSVGSETFNDSPVVASGPVLGEIEAEDAATN